MTAVPALPKLLTLAEYAKLDLPNTELVRGKVIPMNQPVPFHGWVCGNVIGILRDFVRANSLGRVMGNDSGVVTERDPDTVRGADVAFYSYARLPAGPFTRDEYLAVVPELVVEVLSPSDRWSRVLAKVNEYLTAGVTAVCVVDPAAETATVYRDNQPPQAFATAAELIVPDVLPGFRVRVGELWE